MASNAGTKNAGNAVHPIARWVAGLLSPMCLRDQRMLSSLVSRSMFGAALISFVSGYVLENVHLTFYGVAAAGVAMFAVSCPNWRQREDEEQRWCDEGMVKAYYDLRSEILDAVEAEVEEEEGEKAIKGKAPSNSKSAGDAPKKSKQGK
uniref:Uncharacterized protein n=1 Tax=Trypanosoma vivax (strain Y486) TaxID=1055687 RepID=G0TSR0_TRYVY|nr:conserved hypothetical protein [Trypanosoma vivax Y486]